MKICYKIFSLLLAFFLVTLLSPKNALAVDTCTVDIQTTKFEDWAWANTFTIDTTGTSDYGFRRYYYYLLYQTDSYNELGWGGGFSGQFINYTNDINLSNFSFQTYNMPWDWWPNLDYWGFTSTGIRYTKLWLMSWNGTYVSTFKILNYVKPYDVNKIEVVIYGASFGNSPLVWCSKTGNTYVENNPPIANAGPDQTVFVGQTVSFDGSQSTDPDGNTDIVGYNWDFGDGSTGSGLVTSHIYNTSGTYIATLTVTDAAGASNSDSLTVTVQTPFEATQSLIDLVQTFNLQQGIENSLDAKLEAAMGALSDINVQNNVAAANSLDALINAAQAQSGNKLTVEQADAIIQAARNILLHI